MSKEEKRPMSQRERVLDVLRHQPGLRGPQIAKQVGLTVRQCSNLLSKMRLDGKVEHCPDSPGKQLTTWQLGQVVQRALSSHEIKRIKPQAPASKPQRPVITPPRDRSISTERLSWKMAEPARPGATDHEKVPSRRGDRLVPHQPMMLMGSNVRGEFGK